MPYIGGSIFGLWKTAGLLGMVVVIYLIMSVATWTLTVETKGRSLEDVSETVITQSEQTLA